ncbi:MAG: phage tail tape measure protein [Gammaproteobacteria bacterium]
MAIDLGDAIVSITGNDKGLTKTLGSMAGRAGKAMTFAGGAITAALGLAAKTAMDFEQAITDAASVTGKTGDEFIVARDKMAKLAKTLGRTTVFSAREAAKAFWDLSSKGVDVANASVSDLQPILDLAAATQFDLTATTEIVTATMKGFGLEMKDTARIADVFVSANGMSAFSMDKVRESLKFVAPVARSFGLSLEETVAVLNSLFDAGMEGSMAGTSLRGALMALATPTKKMTALSEKLGLSMDEMNPEKVGLTQALRNMNEAGITTQDVLKTFGKQVASVMFSMLGLTDAGTETIDAMESMNKQLGEGTGKAAEVAALQLDTLSGQMKLVASAWEGFILSFANEDVLAALKPMATGLAEIISKVTGWLEANPELARTVFLVTAAIGAALLVLGPLLMVLGLLLPAVGVLASAVMFLIGTFGWLLIPIGAVIAGLAVLGGVIAFWLVTKMRENWNKTVELFDAGKRIVLATLKGMWAAIKIGFKVLETFLGAVFKAIGVQWDGWNAESKKDGETFTEQLEDLADRMEDWAARLESLYDKLTLNNSIVWKAIKLVVFEVAKAFVKSTGEIIGAVGRIVGPLEAYFRAWWKIFMLLPNLVAWIWKLNAAVANSALGAFGLGSTLPGVGGLGQTAGVFGSTSSSAAANLSSGASSGFAGRGAIAININANIQSGSDARALSNLIQSAVKRAVSSQGGYTIRGLEV